jgi:hypothetical protein
VSKELVATELRVYLGDDDLPYVNRMETVVAEGKDEIEFDKNVESFKLKHGFDETTDEDQLPNERRFELVGFVLYCEVRDV